MSFIKFSAPWCAPCKELAKRLQLFSSVSVSDVDIKKNPEEALKFNVRGVPTLVKLDGNGLEVNRLVGLPTVEKLKEFLTEGNTSENN